MGDEAVLERILNGDQEPTDLSFALFKQITDNFSEGRKIGQGGFGVVYKGVYNGQEIAVKLFYDVPGLDNKQFENECVNLLKIRHPNIVRLVGYCYEKRHKYGDYNGQVRSIQYISRILCFEYLQGGSLDKYLNESRDHDWPTRYNIIEGICEGLNFLHKGCGSPILHLDLKPGNILLDKYMGAKLADFGLSNFFSKTHTHITTTTIGTEGYMPPEFRIENLVSSKNDVYSLGVIILEIMTGYRGYSRYREMDDATQFIELVITNWQERINATTPPFPSAELDQMETCIKIAIKCVDPERNNRPTVAEILDTMQETEKRFLEEWRNHAGFLVGQSLPTPTKSGPRGGSGGTARDIKEDPWRLHSLTISYQGLIDSFSFSYIDQSGKKQRVGPWGKECSYHKIETIRFSLSEFVEEVSGAYGSHGEHILVMSLTFVTNIRTYGPFGNSHHQNVAATPFRFMADEGSSIVGFHGRSGSHLFSIGVYMSLAIPTKSGPRGGSGGKVVDEVNLMVVSEPTKPQENCKNREGTNMPADEVPKAKRRKIVESAFGKGKLGSSEKAEAASMAEIIVGSLEDSIKDLIAKKTDVCQKIKNAEREGKKSTNEVDRWLEKVAKIIDVVHVISVECKLKKDVTMEASEKLREVQECLSICPSIVAIESMPPPVQEMPGPSMSAENHNLQDALQYIKDDPKVGMIGIWGPGGVGKTHLLNNINNSFGDGMTFDFVIFVTASRGCSVEKVQSQIIERLRLQSTGSKRLTIYEYMKTKSFLVLLDDLWDEINLEDVGIPYPLGNANKLSRKVVLTTRLRKVCGQMKVKKELKVAYLQEHEAWQLFEENIGAETLSSPHIEALARELMKELKGLPLALITIGKAMYRKDEYQWETAIQYMKQSCCADDKDPVELCMGTNVFRQLKFSYDNLRNKTLRDCFLTCALWPEDAKIRKVDLTQCWMGLGLVNEHDIESSFRKSYSLIADLSDVCLLEGCEDDEIGSSCKKSYGFVKVHDVIRDMALWISCDCGVNNDKWIVAVPGGRDKKVIILSNEAECVSLMSNRIPIRFNPDPLKLRILCLRNERLGESIIGEAIKNCSSPTYLDLSRNSFKRIPEELCSLVKLEHLDLSENQFLETEVPHSFGKLVNLKFLYLESGGCVRIPVGVLCSLKALQVIDLRSYIILEPNLCLPEWIFRELGTLPQLKALGIMVQGPAQFKSILGEATNLPVRYLNLKDLGALIRILSTDFAQRTLCELVISEDIDTREITVEHDTEQPNNHFGALNNLRLYAMTSLREIKWMGATPAFIFPRLTWLDLFFCPCLSHLSWVMYLPRLVQLHISGCSGLVQAFMRCHGDKLCNGQDKTKTFPCLKLLRLDFNLSLETIGDNSMEFPSLERLVIRNCQKLKRLPFQLDSLPLKLKELRFDVAHRWERLECEEGVKSFLQPALKFGWLSE